MRACVVCVPARDEAERLPRLIRSLQDQQGFTPDARLRVLVVVNNTSDGTAQVLADMRASGRISRLDLRVIEAEFPPAEAHVGTARRMALDAGADWLEADGAPDGVLLTTDADARMPETWVRANLDALDHADVVGGRLVLDGEDAPADPALADLHRRIESYWSAVRTLEDRLDPPPHDPAPRHGDHTAASLALAVRQYRAVGGLPVLACGEDNALVGNLQRIGARLRHCPRVEVHASARREGRVSGGMATEMERRAEAVRDGKPYQLPAAGHWESLILRRAALRRAWRGEGETRAAAFARLGLDAEDLASIGPESCPNDIAFVERASQRVEARMPEAVFVDLDRAIADLEALAHRLRDAA